MISKRKGRLVLFTFLILIVSLLPIPRVRAGWLSDWDQRVLISIDSGDIDGALTNFPFLIYISSSSGINNEDLTFIFDEIGANSLKIAVTESDGTTECYVEVENWDFGSEEAWLWVKGPSISSGADTDFYLYYDNDHADNVAFVGTIESIPGEIVWDANFKAVYHMRDKTTASIADSTDNDKDGTKIAANQPVLRVAGIISEDQDFDGNDDRINIPNTIMTGASPFTLEFWFNCDGVNSHDENWQTLIDMRGQYQIYINFFEKDDVGIPGEIIFYIYDGIDTIYIESSELNYATDYYVMATHDAANNMRLYINGVLVDGPDAQDDPAAVSTQNRIGKDYGVATRGNFNGKIEDARISQSARLVSWGLATYETGRDDLLDFGIAESLLPPSDPDLLFGAGFNASSPYVELHWNHSLEDVQFFEVQNSSDGLSWDYLGQTITANYTDNVVVNGTERYYRVRACNQTGGAWYNSSFSDVNFEKVYFVDSGVGAGIIHVESDAPWIALAIILSIIAFLLATRIKR